MVWKNPTDSKFEAELSFPLPDGGAVCGYAVDVENKLVPGVIVTKEKARATFEAEVRKDRGGPAIIEQTVGNVFNTRINPFLPYGSRTIQVSFTQNLTSTPINSDSVSSNYTLPFLLPISANLIATLSATAPGHFQPSISNGHGLTDDFSGRPAYWIKTKDANIGKFFHTLKGSSSAWALSAPLQITLQGSTVDSSIIYEHCSLDTISIAADIRNIPLQTSSSERLSASSSISKIALLWDCSKSRGEGSNDHYTELNALETLLRHFQNTERFELDLYTFNVTPSAKLQTYSHNSLTNVISRLNNKNELLYHGGTNYSNLTRILGADTSSNVPQQYTFWIIVTDGISTFGGQSIPDLMAPVYILSASQTGDPSFLRRWARQSNGKFFNLCPGGSSPNDVINGFNDTSTSFLYAKLGSFLLATEPTPIDDFLEVQPLSNPVSIVPSSPKSLEGGNFRFNARLNFSSPKLKALLENNDERSQDGSETTRLTLYFGTKPTAFVTYEHSFEIDLKQILAFGLPSSVSISERSWAQSRLTEIQEAIESLGKNTESGEKTKLEKEQLSVSRHFTVVTPSTSLIVLETLQQFLDHMIVPPVALPEIYKEYQKRIAARTAEEDSKRFEKTSRVHAWWKRRQQWADENEYIHQRSSSASLDADGNPIEEEIIALRTHGTSATDFKANRHVFHQQSFDAEELNGAPITSRDTFNAAWHLAPPISKNWPGLLERNAKRKPSRLPASLPTKSVLKPVKIPKSVAFGSSKPVEDRLKKNFDFLGDDEDSASESEDGEVEESISLEINEDEDSFGLFGGDGDDESEIMTTKARHGGRTESSALKIGSIGLREIRDYKSEESTGKKTLSRSIFAKGGKVGAKSASKLGPATKSIPTTMSRDEMPVLMDQEPSETFFSFAQAQTTPLSPSSDEKMDLFDSRDFELPGPVWSASSLKDSSRNKDAKKKKKEKSVEFPSERSRSRRETSEKEINQPCAPPPPPSAMSSLPPPPPPVEIALPSPMEPHFNYSDAEGAEEEAYFGEDMPAPKIEIVKAAKPIERRPMAPAKRSLQASSSSSSSVSPIISEIEASQSRRKSKPAIPMAQPSSSLAQEAPLGGKASQLSRSRSSRRSGSVRPADIDYTPTPEPEPEMNIESTVSEGYADFAYGSKSDDSNERLRSAADEIEASHRIFDDLRSTINEQSMMLDSIASNVDYSHQLTQNASIELASASSTKSGASSVASAVGGLFSMFASKKERQRQNLSMPAPAAAPAMAPSTAVPGYFASPAEEMPAQPRRAQGEAIFEKTKNEISGGSGACMGGAPAGSSSISDISSSYEEEEIRSYDSVEKKLSRPIGTRAVLEEERYRSIECVNQIMSTNIERILDRGEMLESLVDRSEDLATGSFQFRRAPHSLKRKQRFKKIGVVVAFLLALAAFVWLLFWSPMIRNFVFQALFYCTVQCLVLLWAAFFSSSSPIAAKLQHVNYVFAHAHFLQYLLVSGACALLARFFAEDSSSSDPIAEYVNMGPLAWATFAACASAPLVFSFMKFMPQGKPMMKLHVATQVAVLPLCIIITYLFGEIWSNRIMHLAVVLSILVGGSHRFEGAHFTLSGWLSYIVAAMVLPSPAYSSYFLQTLVLSFIVYWTAITKIPKLMSRSPSYVLSSRVETPVAFAQKTFEIVMTLAELALYATMGSAGWVLQISLFLTRVRELFVAGMPLRALVLLATYKWIPLTESLTFHMTETWSHVAIFGCFALYFVETGIYCVPLVIRDMKKVLKPYEEMKRHKPRQKTTANGSNNVETNSMLLKSKKTATKKSVSKPITRGDARNETEENYNLRSTRSTSIDNVWSASKENVSSSPISDASISPFSDAFVPFSSSIVPAKEVDSIVGLYDPFGSDFDAIPAPNSPMMNLYDLVQFERPRFVFVSATPEGSDRRLMKYKTHWLRPDGTTKTERNVSQARDLYNAFIASNWSSNEANHIAKVFSWAYTALTPADTNIAPIDETISKSDLDFALTVMSNLAEGHLGKVQLLRSIAYKLEECGLWVEAEQIYRRILESRGEEPQSYRDLALVLSKQKKYNECVALYDKILTRCKPDWDARFSQIEIVALMDLCGILPSMNILEESSVAGFKIPYSIVPAAANPVNVDIRAILTWDVDGLDLELQVQEPDGTKLTSFSNQSPTGGLLSRDFAGGYGPVEFVARRAFSGTYHFVARVRSPTSKPILGGECTLRFTLFTNFGLPDLQSSQTRVHRFNPAQNTQVSLAQLIVTEGTK